MQRSSRIRSFVFIMIVSFAGGVGAAPAGNGSVAGSFTVNNKLPAGWDLATVLMAEGSTVVLASHPATSKDSAVAFSFTDLDAGSYRTRLLATRNDTVLALSQTTVLEVAAESPEAPVDTWKAMGSGGAVFGEIELSGEPPEGKMILVRVRRIDINLEGQFPDQLNAFTVEVQPDEIEAGRADYDVGGLSHGLYAVELIAYDYATHTTRPIDAYKEDLVVDLDHKEHQNIDFKVDF